MQSPINVLVIKLGASGDVVRTTPLLALLPRAQVDWYTTPLNSALLPSSRVGILTEPQQLRSHYDLVISLEDDAKDLDKILSKITYNQLIGAYLHHDKVVYSDEIRSWFDLSLVSRFGLHEADRLKFLNRLTYQEHLFRALGHEFGGQPYLLPDILIESQLAGDIAFAPEAGARWPMKEWAHYRECIEHFGKQYRVNVLPKRTTLAEHIADIRNHRVVVCNDSLPMHLAIALGKPTIAFFTCTSPWEIYDYGLLHKLESPFLEEFWYKKHFDPKATHAISLMDATKAIEMALENSEALAEHG